MRKVWRSIADINPLESLESDNKLVTSRYMTRLQDT